MTTPTFKASLDNASKLISGAIILFALVFVLFGLFIFTEDRIALILPIVILLAVSGFTYLYSPKGYSIENNFILVHRLAGLKKIPRSEIYEIRAISEEELGTTWRMFGNGGLFGYTGWFSTSIGKMRWYLSQRKNYVLFRLNNEGLILISPDDVEGFLQASM